MCLPQAPSPPHKIQLMALLLQDQIMLHHRHHRHPNLNKSLAQQHLRPLSPRLQKSLLSLKLHKKLQMQLYLTRLEKSSRQKAVQWTSLRSSKTPSALMASGSILGTLTNLTSGTAVQSPSTSRLPSVTTRLESGWAVLTTTLQILHSADRSPSLMTSWCATT